MKRAGFSSGFYAVRILNSDLGFEFYKEYRLAKMRAMCEGVSSIRYFTVEDYELHMELYYNSGITYGG